MKKNFGYKKYMKQKSQNDISTLKIFICSFVFMLVVFTILINCFSPEVDVSIGNQDENSAIDIDNGIYLKKFVDNRLLAIQEEDRSKTEFPKNTEMDTNEKAANLIESISVPETGEMKPVELVAIVPEVKIATPHTVVEQAENTTARDVANITYRVYIGFYNTYDQVKIAKDIVNETDPELRPVIKEVNGGYTLQAGVFKNKEAAATLTNNLLKEHLPARMISE